eukprot:m.155878 g.155878  ORF g.155878 m.155878 type:complete len:919 (-) comp13331_c0_seq4:210-2966(-)
MFGVFIFCTCLVVSVCFLLNTVSAARRLYVTPYDVYNNPITARNFIQPPTRALIGNVTRFAASRGLPMNSTGYVVNYQEYIKNMTSVLATGDVLWPTFNFLNAVNLVDVLKFLNSNDILVTDVWDYVPGDTDACGLGQTSGVCEFKLNPSQKEALNTYMPDRFTGMDIGEQDGRYVGRYASQLPVQDVSRFEQYVNMFRYFDRMSFDLGDKLSVLSSLYMPHYIAKPGTVTSIASETAQGLPNAQLFMSFCRGAAKQYSAWWWANVSVYNRFGHKSYPSDPEGGTSLSLMKRLMYSQIMYSSVYASFEADWTYPSNNSLTPIGRIQANARKWVHMNQKNIGSYLAPVGILIDFLAGWTPPRNLYSGVVYKVWGFTPYDGGDHLTHAVLDHLYPNYADSSYFHDERGFQVPTPFGDVVDSLLSDVQLSHMLQYSVIVVATNLCPSTSPIGCASIATCLSNYVSQGGVAVITSTSLANLGESLLGFSVGRCQEYPAGTIVNGTSFSGKESHPFNSCAVDFSACANCTVTTLSSVNTNTAIAWEVAYGNGSFVVSGTPFGISNSPVVPLPIVSSVDKHLPTVYPLLNHFQAQLANVYAQNVVTFSVNNANLTYSVSSVSSTQYTVSIFNPTYEEQFFNITSCLPIQNKAELHIMDDESHLPEYLVPGVDRSKLGNNTATTIAGASPRIFSISVSSLPSSTCASLLPKIVPPTPRSGVMLSIHSSERDIVSSLLSRVEFKWMYDSVIVDWRTIQSLSQDEVSTIRRYLRLQKIKLYVDLTSGINLYPDMRMVMNAPDDYAKSLNMMKNVITLTNALGGSDVVFSLHIIPENYESASQAKQEMQQTIANISQFALQYNTTLHFRLVPGRLITLADMEAFVDACYDAGAARNIKYAISAGFAIQTVQVNCHTMLFLNPRRCLGS